MKEQVDFHEEMLKIEQALSREVRAIMNDKEA